MPSRYSIILLCGILATGCGEKKNARDASQSATASRLQIAVIPKGTTHQFWRTVHAGAAKAAKESGVEIIWLGPENEDDRKQQIEVVQNFVARGVNAIVLAPLDEVALVRPVETAVGRRIPVVIIDSDLKSGVYSSFVATDNREGGRRGAQRLGALMGGKGNALLLRYNEGSASTFNREEGFLEEMQKSFPGVRMVSTNQYAGVTKESALQASQNLLAKYGNDLQGIFCPNESSSFGMLRALEISGFAGKIHFVGFDASEGLVDGLRSGAIQGLVAQDPFDMGYQGVRTAVQVLHGETVARRVPTKLAVITPENINDPAIRELISPELEKWLQ
jgi:ribose transport system substrate-binding protein